MVSVQSMDFAEPIVMALKQLSILVLKIHLLHLLVDHEFNKYCAREVGLAM